jgi:hypothetical protein
MTTISSRAVEESSADVFTARPAAIGRRTDARNAAEIDSSREPATICLITEISCLYP